MSKPESGEPVIASDFIIGKSGKSFTASVIWNKKTKRLDAVFGGKK
jgi:hypothetical protein